MKKMGSAFLLVTAVLAGCSESPTSPRAMSAPAVVAQCNTTSNNSNNPPVTAGNCGNNGDNNTGNNSNNPPTTANH
jgi:hypothetical protein